MVSLLDPIRFGPVCTDTVSLGRNLGLVAVLHLVIAVMHDALAQEDVGRSDVLLDHVVHRHGGFTPCVVVRAGADFPEAHVQRSIAELMHRYHHAYPALAFVVLEQDERGDALRAALTDLVDTAKRAGKPMAVFRDAVSAVKWLRIHDPRMGQLGVTALSAMAVLGGRTPAEEGDHFPGGVAGRPARA